MFLFFIIGLAIGLWSGYEWGYSKGTTRLERKVLKTVTESPVFNQGVVEALSKAFQDKVKR